MKTNDHRPTAPDRLHALVEGLRPSSAPPPEAPAAHLRASPERPNTRVLILIGLIAALVAGAYLWAARPRPAASPERMAPASPASLAATPSAMPASASAMARVTVHVLGKVERPGVVTLPSGARVAEAIEAAGGVRRGAATGTLNLARRVVDGEQIPVGIRPPPQAPGTAAPASPGPGAPLDLNTATAEQLDGLPGVGPVLAERILGYRTQHGGFRSVDQLQEVNGIGARRYADLKPMVRV
ncbi:ComEA family DNA-binding protein [Spirillospora albida]|uniref:ComEA family DNA-binding protein n=1 Tax=Spirillospora albida TaxID=58123 RepID=UPI000A05C971|nr:ComEA family DNA-binding protein [Spirillospora albida]